MHAQQQQGYGQTPWANQQYQANMQQQLAAYGAQAQQAAQQAAQQPQAQQPQAAAGGEGEGVGDATHLVVAGCTHATVGPTIRGNYVLHGENHKKPTYKRDAQVNGLDVMMYFWDDRDGPAFSGWWFGPVVGGDQVWAYQPSQTSVGAPRSGWKVPYDGPVDASLIITGSKGQAPQQQPQQQQMPQQQQQQQQQWGQMQQQQGQQQGQQWGAQWGQAQQQAGRQQSAAEDLRRRQQMIMDQQKKMVDMRQQQEEMKRQQEEQQKRMLEEQRIKNEEMKAKAEAEAKAKEEELARKREEQRALMGIRRAMQKLRYAKEEDFAELEGEMRAEIEKQRSTCSTQVEKIQEEANKAAEQAKARISIIKEQQRKEEERKAAEEAKRQEAIEKAERLCKELLGLVEVNEAAGKSLKELAEGLSEEGLSVDAIKQGTKDFEDAKEDAKKASKTCTEFIAKHGPELKAPSPVKGIAVPPPSLDAPEEKEKISLPKLVTRINETNKLADLTAKQAKSTGEAALRKAVGREKMASMQKTFDKFAKDGILTREQAVKYAKQTYGCVVPSESMERIMRTLGTGSNKGIKKDDFHLLKIAVGVVREKSLDEKRRLVREEHEKRLATLKEGLEEQLKEAEGPVTQAIESVVKAEARVRAAAGPKATDLLEQAAEAEEMAKAAKDLVVSAKKIVEELSEGVDEELKSWITGESRKIELKLKPLDIRLHKVNAMAAKMKDQGKKKDADEITKIREKVVAAFRYHQLQKVHTGEELFEEIDTNNNGRIEESEFMSFYAKCDKPLGKSSATAAPAAAKSSDEAPAEDAKDEEKKEDGEAKPEEKPAEPEKVEEPLVDDKDLARLFEHLDIEEVGYIEKDHFLRIIRQFFKIVKDTVLTAGIGIKDGKTLRRLECGEVISVIKGPTAESSNDLMRVNAKCMTDGLVGWVTVEGNQGSKYLQEGGNVFKVVKETILTEFCDLSGGSKESTRKLKDTTRKLREGELVEVLEWPQKDDSGLMRMQCRVKSDGSVGWATTVGTTGIVFLEVV